MADGAKKDLTWLWVTVAAIVVVGFFVFRTSIAPVKTPKINLVPEGTQRAFNPYTMPGMQQYQPMYYNDRYYLSDMAYYDMMTQQAYAQSDQNIAYAETAGDFLNNLTDNIFG